MFVETTTTTTTWGWIERCSGGHTWTSPWRSRGWSATSSTPPKRRRHSFYRVCRSCVGILLSHRSFMRSVAPLSSSVVREFFTWESVRIFLARSPFDRTALIMYERGLNRRKNNYYWLMGNDQWWVPSIMDLKLNIFVLPVRNDLSIHNKLKRYFRIINRYCQ